MGTTPRIDQLTAPPEVGGWYMVPTVHGRWHGKAAHWPVMGTLHEDTKFFRFNDQHYHLDRRFLALADTYSAVGAPLHHGPAPWKGRGQPTDPMPAPVWRRLRCRRSEMGFPSYVREVKEMQAALAGAQCQRDDIGWICPHRQFSLGSIAADAAGIITCPLHGLRIAAATGLVVRPTD